MSPLWWINLAACLGIAILAVPAFSLNMRKKTLERLRGIVARRGATGSGPALEAVAAELQAEQELAVARWRPVDEVCLYAGYFLLLGASVARLFLDG